MLNLLGVRRRENMLCGTLKDGTLPPCDLPEQVSYMALSLPNLAVIRLVPRCLPHPLLRTLGFELLTFPRFGTSLLELLSLLEAQVHIFLPLSDQTGGIIL